MSKLKIYLSPSKQPNNLYTGVKTNEEKEMVGICQEMMRILKREYECSVFLSTLTLGIGANERPKEAKNQGATLYLAIHSNAGGGGKAAGAVALYHPKSEDSRKLGQVLINELNAISPLKSNRSLSLVDGMKAFFGKGYGEIRVPYSNNMTPLLMETNFHDHPVLAKWITTHHEVIARAYIKGLVSYYRIPKRRENTKEELDERSEVEPESDKLYRVQVGAFRSRENAENLIARLFNEGFEGIITYQ